MPEPETAKKRRGPSNSYTIGFIVALSFICSTILATLATALAGPQQVARELYRSKQMLVAARIYDQVERHFQVRDEEGHFISANYTHEGRLEATDDPVEPSDEEILEVYRLRFSPFLADAQGDLETFQEAGVNKEEYLSEHTKTGYYKLPLKLLYKIYTNPAPAEEIGDPEERPVEGYVLPINGQGLWDAIYGYLALGRDANTVIGISWYEHGETPGLGANISEWNWQSLFPGKQVIQELPAIGVDPLQSPLGIIVVRGKVEETLGSSPKAKSAVDGMAGATLTGNGVTQAYEEVLSSYRPWIIKTHNAYKQEHGE